MKVIDCEKCYFCEKCFDKIDNCEDYTPFLPDDDYEDRIMDKIIELDRDEYYEAYQEYLDVDSDVDYSYI